MVVVVAPVLLITYACSWRRAGGGSNGNHGGGGGGAGGIQLSSARQLYLNNCIRCYCGLAVAVIVTNGSKSVLHYYV